MISLPFGKTPEKPINGFFIGLALPWMVWSRKVISVTRQALPCLRTTVSASQRLQTERFVALAGRFSMGRYGFGWPTGATLRCSRDTVDLLRSSRGAISVTDLPSIKKKKMLNLIIFYRWRYYNDLYLRAKL